MTDRAPNESLKLSLVGQDLFGQAKCKSNSELRDWPLRPVLAGLPDFHGNSKRPLFSRIAFYLAEVAAKLRFAARFRW